MKFEDILKDCINGYTKKEIAERNYYAPGTISLKIKQHMPVKEFNELVDRKQKERYLYLHGLGATDRVIAKKMRLTYQALYNRKKKWGIM